MPDSRMWKYLSIALMSILALGVLQPQAFAMTDAQLKKKFAEIMAAINALTTKTNDLQTQIDNIALTPGEDGLNCWDLDGDGVKDADEDTNDDGNWDALDCKAQSSGFSPNTAPIVDAGTDQTVFGIASDSSGGCPIINLCPPTVTYTLVCEFDIAGTVQDDEFTGYLAHKWTTVNTLSNYNPFSDDDELSTHVTFVALSIVPFSGSLPIPVTLTADDGILEASDEVLLNCQVP